MNGKENVIDDDVQADNRDPSVTSNTTTTANGNPSTNESLPESHPSRNTGPAADQQLGIKQSIRVTRSDPLSATSDKSHLIRSKHNNHHNHSSRSQPSSSANYHSRERRARWIRDRMSAGIPTNNNHYHNSGDNYQQHHHCCGCSDLEQNRQHRPQSYNNRQWNWQNHSSDDFGWSPFEGSSTSTTSVQGQNPRHRYNKQSSSGNWISENESKATRFHRPYSFREQGSSWASASAPSHNHHCPYNQDAAGDHYRQYQNRKEHRQQERLRAGRSLPIPISKDFHHQPFQQLSSAVTSATTADQDIVPPTSPINTVSFLEQRQVDKQEGEGYEDVDEDRDEDDEEEEEESDGEPVYLTRQKKLPYPYCLKSQPSGAGEKIVVSQNLGVGVPPLEIVRRSRSGSPCSITSESTESLGDCENALDPPNLTLPNGDIGGGTTPGGAVPVTCGLPPNQYNGNGRKFSVLFSSHDTWSEETIIQSFKELSPTATNLFEAAWTGNLNQLEELLGDEEILEKLKDPGPTGFRDGEGRTPLHLASACGHVHCVELLLQKGSPINVIDENENRATPLACAASYGSVPVIKALLAGGADVNSGYEQGKTALHWAIQASSVECAKILLEAGAKQNPPQVYSETPLHVSASLGDPECLQLLLDYGADMNLCKGSNRSTALHLSSEEGSAACVRLLLKGGASHAAKDIRGHSALHVAATCDADCVIALLKAGADPNAVDANGRTPLHCAVARGSRAAECVRLLVESGADIDAQDNYGYTPLHLSAVNESSQCASILLHHGSDVTLKTNAGTTALSLLVRRIPDVMRYLVDRLDSAVTIHDHDPADPDCEVRLDFRAIVPNCEKRHGNGKSNGNAHAGGSDKKKQDYFNKPHKETEFLTCLVAAGNKKILAHPLSEAFLTLKWQRVRKFFWASLLFQIALVALFTIYVIEVYLVLCPYRRDHHVESNNHHQPPLAHGGGDASVYTGGGRPPEPTKAPSGIIPINIIPPPPTPRPPSTVPPDPYKVLQTRNDTDSSSHNLTRRSADPNPKPGFEWFRWSPPRRENRTRTSKHNKSIDGHPNPIPAPPSAPTPRNRGRVVNVIIGETPPPQLGPAAAPATGRPPEETGNENESSDPRKEPIDCRLSPSLKIIWILLVAFASLMAIKEIFQLLQSPLSYVVSSENWGQWLLICSVTMTAWSTPEFQLEYWQYPAAACGIFLAWGLMLLQVGRFPALGLYVQMLGKVAANFGLFILAYACLLIAFALAFCVLFHEHPPYSGVFLSILKVFTMMVGEVDYEDLFYGNNRLDDPLLFPLTAHLLYGAFVVIVTIVLMNLLVGLAVHDIQGLQKGAKLNRLSRQTALVSRLESLIFSKKLQTILPRSLGSVLQKSALLVPSSYNWSFYFRPNDVRDKRLPKDIKQAALRLAASRHSGTKSKSPHRHSHLTNNQHHRNTHTAGSNTPNPIVRPISSVSQHQHSHSALLSPHPEIAMRRVEQRLDHLQHQLEKAMRSLNGRLDTILGEVKIPEGFSRQLSQFSSGKRSGGLPSVMSQKSQSDIENDNVFLEVDEENALMKSDSQTPSPGLTRRNKPSFSTTPSFFERCQL